MTKITSRIRYLGDANKGEIEILTEMEQRSAAQQAAQARLRQMGLPGEWSELGEVYRSEHLVVTRDPVRFPGGALGTYVVVDWAEEKNRGGVVIIPRLSGKYVLIRHFRHATRAWHWEFPRGFRTSDNLENDARKELQEEIGATAHSITRLGGFYPDSGMTSNYVTVLGAEITRLDGFDREEGISAVRLVTAEEIEKMVRDGAIDDGISMMAYCIMHAFEPKLTVR